MSAFFSNSNHSVNFDIFCSKQYSTMNVTFFHIGKHQKLSSAESPRQIKLKRSASRVSPGSHKHTFKHSTSTFTLCDTYRHKATCACAALLSSAYAQLISHQFTIVPQISIRKTKKCLVCGVAYPTLIHT